MTFTARRNRNILITFLVGAVLLTATSVYDVSLYQGPFLTGWLLLISMLLLSLYGVRKKLTMLPSIGRSAIWVQFHVYLGYLCIGLFAIHIEFRVPDGWLEIMLAVLFVLVAGSGVLGIIISRGLPRQLTRKGEEVIFERIPQFIRELRMDAENLVVNSVTETNSTTIHDFYASNLRAYFERPRHTLDHITGSTHGLFTLLTEFDNMQRYLNDKEKEFSNQLRDLVVKKDELDFHHALQGLLKGWLFVHVPLIYSLLLVAVVHLVLVYAFSGGM
ncbi:MAG: hypothetical protein HN673_12860 [Rhodospirillales bacterium]|nr:hypothetical protein [Rhodospirillales bacterium]